MGKEGETILTILKGYCLCFCKEKNLSPIQIKFKLTAAYSLDLRSLRLFYWPCHSYLKGLQAW